MREYFFCYSGRLKNFLKASGLNYSVRAINPSNNQLYWMFDWNEELERVLQLWQKYKVEFGGGETDG